MEWGWELESVVQFTGLPASERDLGLHDFEATHAELTGEATGAVADCAAYKPLLSKSPKGGELGAADRARARAASPRSTTKEPTVARTYYSHKCTCAHQHGGARADVYVVYKLLLLWSEGEGRVATLPWCGTGAHRRARAASIPTAVLALPVVPPSSVVVGCMSGADHFVRSVEASVFRRRAAVPGPLVQPDLGGVEADPAPAARLGPPVRVQKAHQPAAETVEHRFTFFSAVAPGLDPEPLVPVVGEVDGAVAAHPVEEAPVLNEDVLTEGDFAGLFADSVAMSSCGRVVGLTWNVSSLAPGHAILVAATCPYRQKLLERGAIRRLKGPLANASWADPGAMFNGRVRCTCWCVGGASLPAVCPGAGDSSCVVRVSFVNCGEQRCARIPWRSWAWRLQRTTGPALWVVMMTKALIWTTSLMWEARGQVVVQMARLVQQRVVQKWALRTGSASSAVRVWMQRL